MLILASLFGRANQILIPHWRSISFL